jgi:hypothetical protein
MQRKTRNLFTRNIKKSAILTDFIVMTYTTTLLIVKQVPFAVDPLKRDPKDRNI